MNWDKVEQELASNFENSQKITEELQQLRERERELSQEIVKYDRSTFELKELVGKCLYREFTDALGYPQRKYILVNDAKCEVNSNYINVHLFGLILYAFPTDRTSHGYKFVMEGNALHTEVATSFNNLRNVMCKWHECDIEELREESKLMENELHATLDMILHR